MTDDAASEMPTPEMPVPELRCARAIDDGAWEAIRHIRTEVFVEEQDCPPEEEFDGLDAEARHVVGLVDGEPVACARWRVVRYQGAPAAKLERFAILESHRGKGYGRPLVRHVMEEARAAGHRRMFLHAQKHLEDFYASLGFQSDGHEFEEAGIPHVRMALVEPASEGSAPV